MTAESRFERDLTSILEDLYLGPSPDYRDEAMAAAARTRQRPSWTFAGRWLPMADIASRPAIGAARSVARRRAGARSSSRLPLPQSRSSSAARQTKVPPPFGLAAQRPHHLCRRGRHLHGRSRSRRIDARSSPGPDVDAGPVFSPDGTRIAFRRANLLDGSPAEDIVVVGADGSRPVVDHRGARSRAESGALSSGRRTLARSWSTRRTTRRSGSFDATTTAPPRTVASGAGFYVRPFRPPDGLVDPDLPADRSRRARSCSLDLATWHETVLATGGPATDLGSARWSPDGSQVVYNAVPSRRSGVATAVHRECRRHRSAPDHAVHPASGFDIDAAWSPDGKSIAFTRYRAASARIAGDVRPIGIYSLADGKVTDARPAASRRARAGDRRPADQRCVVAARASALEWSPDGTSLIAFPSEATGHPVAHQPGRRHVAHPRQLSQPEPADQTWQRQAP